MRPEGQDPAAWCGEVDDDFVPWRPGDPTTGAGPDGAPLEPARGFEDSRRLLRDLPDRIGRGEPAAPDPARRTRPDRSATPERKPFRWSEDSRRYEHGDRVRAAGALGDGIMRTVRQGMRGEVVQREERLLGGERLTVEFENGYRLENVQPGDLERRGMFD